MVRTHKNLEAAKKTKDVKANKDHDVWEKRLKRLSKEVFACQSDAQAAWQKATKKVEVRLRVQMSELA